jgi:hypothetical protein
VGDCEQMDVAALSAFYDFPTPRLLHDALKSGRMYILTCLLECVWMGGGFGHTQCHPATTTIFSVEETAEWCAHAANSACATAGLCV